MSAEVFARHALGGLSPTLAGRTGCACRGKRNEPETGPVADCCPGKYCNGTFACLDRAAANVGATGGSRIRLDAVTIDAMGGKTYRYEADVRATYPDRRFTLSFSCTATGQDIEDFDFITED
jgi:hypothetical protein